MCYQAFIHHACGHGEIIDANCELAEGQPLYFKQACPNYQSESKFPDTFCGAGRFYCTHAELDGQWLDALQHGLWRCNAEIWITEGKIHAVLLKTKEFMNCAIWWNVSPEASRQHPAYPKLKDVLERLEKDKAEKEAVRDQAIAVMDQAREYFARRGEAITVSLVAKPAFVPSEQILNKVSLELGQDAQVYPNPLGPCIPEAAPVMYTPVMEQSKAASQAGSLIRKNDSGLDLLEGENKGEHSTVDDIYQGGDSSNIRDAKRAEVTTPTKTTSAGSIPKQPTSSRKDHLAKRVLKRQLRNDKARSSRGGSPEKLTPATEDNSFVRRSNRARKKTVSYAESTGSDFSRDMSPAKSESSPEKSDWSPSSERSPEPPAKLQSQSQDSQQPEDDHGQRLRSTENLASKIGDWKRRTGNYKDETSSTLTLHEDWPTVSGQYLTSNQLNRMEKPRKRRSKRAKGAASGAQGGQPAYPGMYILDNAIVSRNIFNEYLHQSMPSGIAQAQRVQFQHPFDPREYSEQQPTKVHYQLPEPIFDHSMPQPNDQQTHNAGSAIETTDCGPSMNQMPESSFGQASSMATQSHGYQSGYDFSSTPHAPYTPQESIDENAHSVTEDYVRQNLPRVDLSTYFDYDRMNRSFGATQNLSPPKTPGIFVTDFDLEPKKRAPTASSPAPAAKRVRLSLPGEDGGVAESAVSCSDESFSYGAGSRMATSSPAKMSFQQAHAEFIYAMKNDEDAIAPAPPPIIAPTAITYPRSQTVSKLENMCKDATGVEDSGGGEIGSGAEQRNWDDGLPIDGMDEIDWALLDDDDGFTAFAGL